MPVDVTTEIVINRRLDDVAAYAADPTNAPEWYANIMSVEWQTPPPLTTGSKLAFVAHFLGRRLAYTYEVTAYEPGRRLTMRTAHGPFPMETAYTWDPFDGNRTRMTLRNRGEPRGFSRIAAPALGAAIRRANRKDLARLKELLERSQDSSNR
ncbi:MAG: SRPBCC family protein [Actinomycetota bacterium]